MISGIKKILESAVFKKEYRPILKGVHYESGDVIATDSHKLVVFHDMVKKDLNLTIDLSTCLPIEGKYPDTSHLIANSYDDTVNLELDETEKLAAFLKPLKKQYIMLSYIGNSLNIAEYDYKTSSKKEGGSEYSKKIADSGDSKKIADSGDVKIVCNANYLYNALAYLKRLNKEDSKDFSGKVSLNFIRSEKGGYSFKPFLVKYGKLDYLICPVRIF